MANGKMGAKATQLIAKSSQLRTVVGYYVLPFLEGWVTDKTLQSLAEVWRWCKGKGPHLFFPSRPFSPRYTHARLLTFVSIVGNLTQVNEMGANGHVIDLVGVSDLHLHAFAEWGKQVCKDDLLIPQWLIAALLH